MASHKNASKKASSFSNEIMFNPNLGGLFRGSFWDGGLGEGEGGKITPYLKLRIMLETWSLVRKYTPICSLRKYIF